MIGADIVDIRPGRRDLGSAGRSGTRLEAYFGAVRFALTRRHDATIYKILRAEEWRAAQRDGVYRGSPDDARDGFIHFSTAEQTPGTYEKYFAGQRDLVLVGDRRGRTRRGVEVGALTRRRAVSASLRRLAADGRALVARAYFERGPETARAIAALAHIRVRQAPEVSRTSSRRDCRSSAHGSGRNELSIMPSPRFCRAAAANSVQTPASRIPNSSRRSANR